MFRAKIEVCFDSQIQGNREAGANPRSLEEREMPLFFRMMGIDAKIVLKAPSKASAQFF
jgi:hypothetical protein